MSRLYRKEFSQYAQKIPLNLGDLDSWEYYVTQTVPLKEIVKELEARPDLPGVMVMDRDDLIGMISRNDCFEKLSRPFSLDLFLQKPVGDLLPHFSTPYEVFAAETHIQDAVPHILSRPNQQLYEPVVVQFSGNGYRLVDVHDVLLAQSLLLQESNQKIMQQVNISRALAGSLDMQKLTATLLETVEGIMPQTRKVIILKTGDTFRIQNMEGFPAAVSTEDIQSALLKALSGRYFRNSITTPVPVLNPDPPVQHDAWSADYAWMFFPITHSEELIAAILTGRPYSDETPDTVFESYEVENLAAYCPMFATAFRNAQLYHEVQTSSITDPLTRVFNRRGLYEHKEHQAFAVLMLDIDLFKHINDTYGHLTGDQVIRMLVEILHGIVRPVDKISRYGGDEFVILLDHTDLPNALTIAERIRSRVSSNILYVEENDIQFTVSIGAAESQSQDTLDQVLQRADAQLYQAKESGRNCVFPRLLNGFEE